MTLSEDRVTAETLVICRMAVPSVDINQSVPQWQHKTAGYKQTAIVLRYSAHY